MLVNAKRIAFLGLLLAFDMILIFLGNVIEMNTFFFLAAASFCVGIAIRECGLSLGFGFYAGSILLSLILAPNKLYCITYGAMGCYLFFRELIWEKIIDQGKEPFLKPDEGNMQHSKKKGLFWVLKFIIFNIIYIPLIIFFPKLIYSGELSNMVYGLLFVGGQAVFLVYDYAYNYFQIFIWGKLRKMLHVDLKN